MTLTEKNTYVLSSAGAATAPPNRSASVPAARYPAGDPIATDLEPGITSLAARQPRSPREQVLYARMATDSWTRRDSFSLRHLCYLSEGYIDEQPNREFSDEYDFSGQSQTIVLYQGVEPIGSVRVCTARHTAGERLPLAQTFPQEFGRFYESHASSVEINRLVCHPSYSQNQTVFALIRMADYLIRIIRPGFIGICVRTNHVGFWKRLRFENIAGPRTYKGLNFPTNFLALSCERCELVRRVIPMLRISEAELEAYGRLLLSDTVKVFGHE